MDSFGWLFDEYNELTMALLKEDGSLDIERTQKSSDHSTPNLYHCRSEAHGETIEEKCANCAREAIAAMFPEARIECASLRRSYFRKEDLLKSAVELPSRFDLKNKGKEYKEFCNRLESALREKHFKEYYELSVDIYKDATKARTTNWLVEVDLKFEEVAIIKDGLEFEHFIKSLGPDYDFVWTELNDSLMHLLG